MLILFSRGKNIFYKLAALVRKILFCHSKIKFISSRPRVISSIGIKIVPAHSTDQSQRRVPNNSCYDGTNMVS